MIPTIFEIPLPFGFGPIPLHSFGLMMLLCFLTAWRCLELCLIRCKEDGALAEQMITWAALGGIIGARLSYIISFPQEFFRAPLATLFGGAGFVFYGGFIGGVFAVWLLLRKKNKDFLLFSDITAACLAVGYAVGRVGCQLSGDGDYGSESTLPWAMSYALGVVPTPEGVLVHPTPVYETFAALAIAWFLLQESTRTKFAKRGQLFGCYLLLSSLSRILVEYVRIEPVVLGGLTQAQLIGLGLGAIGLVLLFRKDVRSSAFVGTT